MGCQENRSAALGHATQKSFEHTRCERVDAFERLIQKQNPRPVNDRGGKRQFLLHAMRVVRDQRFGAVRELHEIQQLVRALLCHSAI